MTILTAINQSPAYLAHKARLLAAAESDAYTRMFSPSPLSSSHLNPSNSKPLQPNIFDPPNSKLAALAHHHPATEDPNYTDPLTPSLVLNIFLSVLITGFSVYWALTSFTTPEILIQGVSAAWRYTPPSEAARGRHGGSGVSDSVRVLFSLLVALGVGLTEVFIYGIYLGKIEKARGKEAKLREEKTVVGREEVGGKSHREIPAEAQAGAAAETDSNSGEVGSKEKDEDVIWGRGPNGGLRRRVREKWEETTKDQHTKDGES